MTDSTAVILTGGRGSRLGHADKAEIRVGASTLLDRVLAGTRDDQPVVVVGPRAETTRAVTFTMEEPRFGGPVAAIAAAMAEVSTALVTVLAVDMPDGAAVAAECARRLAGRDDIDALIPVDGMQRRQSLCAAYRAEALRGAIRNLGEVDGRAMRDLVAGLQVEEWPLDPAEASLVADIDTPEDLAGYRRRVSGSVD